MERSAVPTKDCKSRAGNAGVGQAQVRRRQSPRLSPARAVSTGSRCRGSLTSRILLRMKREVQAVTWADQRSLCPRQELPGVLQELAADAPRTLPTCGVPFPLHNWVLSLGRICKPLSSSDALRPNCTAGFVREEKIKIDGFSSFIIIFFLATQK